MPFWARISTLTSNLRNKTTRNIPRMQEDIQHVDGKPTKIGLLDLPMELLMTIMDYLETSDVACLALCSRLSHLIIGTSSWDSLRIGQCSASQRRQFLLRIASGREGLALCHNCLQLHTFTSTATGIGPSCRWFQLPNPHFHSGMLGMNTAGSPVHPFETHEIPTGYKLDFAAVQNVMTFRREASADRTKALSLLSTTEVHVSATNGLTSLFSVEARIVRTTRLFLRIQQWIFPSDPSSLPLIPDLQLLGICTHIQRTARLDTPDLFRCKLNHSDSRMDPGCPTCHHLLKCRECGIEFQVVFENLTRANDHGPGEIYLFPSHDRPLPMTASERAAMSPAWARKNVLFVTKWMDLGRGLTSDDPDWLRHFPPTTSTLAPTSFSHASSSAQRRTDERSERRVSMPFSIIKANWSKGLRNSFERDWGKSQTAKTIENASILHQGMLRHGFADLKRGLGQPGKKPEGSCYLVVVELGGGECVTGETFIDWLFDARGSS